MYRDQSLRFAANIRRLDAAYAAITTAAAIGYGSYDQIVHARKSAQRFRHTLASRAGVHLPGAQTVHASPTPPTSELADNLNRHVLLFESRLHSGSATSQEITMALEVCRRLSAGVIHATSYIDGVDLSGSLPSAANK